MRARTLRLLKSTFWGIPPSEKDSPSSVVLTRLPRGVDLVEFVLYDIRACQRSFNWQSTAFVIKNSLFSETPRNTRKAHKTRRFLRFDPSLSYPQLGLEISGYNRKLRLLFAWVVADL